MYQSNESKKVLCPIVKETMDHGKCEFIRIEALDNAIDNLLMDDYGFSYDDSIVAVNVYCRGCEHNIKSVPIRGCYKHDGVQVSDYFICDTNGRLVDSERNILTDTEIKLNIMKYIQENHLIHILM